MHSDLILARATTSGKWKLNLRSIEAACSNVPTNATFTWLQRWEIIDIFTLYIFFSCPGYRTKRTSRPNGMPSFLYSCFFLIIFCSLKQAPCLKRIHFECEGDSFSCQSQQQEMETWSDTRVALDCTRYSCFLRGSTWTYWRLRCLLLTRAHQESRDHVDQEERKEKGSVWKVKFIHPFCTFEA